MPRQSLVFRFPVRQIPLQPLDKSTVSIPVPDTCQFHQQRLVKSVRIPFQQDIHRLFQPFPCLLGFFRKHFRSAEGRRISLYRFPVCSLCQRFLSTPNVLFYGMEQKQIDTCCRQGRHSQTQ